MSMMTTRSPASFSEICAQLRLYRELVDSDGDRDERLFGSIMAGLARIEGATLP